MKTKQVELWVDLWPGWQDSAMDVFVMSQPPTEKYPGTKRIKIMVELPCFGGSEEVDHVVRSTSEVVKDGLLKTNDSNP